MEPTFEELFRQTKRSDVHLEMRDGYTRSDQDFVSWSKAPLSVPPLRPPETRPWLSLMKEITGRGVEVRRARVFSEPMSDYLRYEHHLTPSNVAAGEIVRWLPRRRASDLALPGNDFWLFDDNLVLFLHFSRVMESCLPRETRNGHVHLKWSSCAARPSRRCGNGPFRTRRTGRSEPRTD